MSDADAYRGRAERLMPALCWSCHSAIHLEQGETPALFCQACGALQPPQPDATLFQVLGLPQQFCLERLKLDQACRLAQRQLHPDRFRDRSPRERLYAEQHAMRINEAAAVLRDPVRRGEYLLACLGHPVPPGETVQDPEILTQSLMQREALADASTPAELATLAAATTTAQQQCESRTATAFATADLATAARELLRLRYLGKFALLVQDRQRGCDAGASPS